MAKKGLVRVPYYPQLHCLQAIHEYAPQVMSLLLFWMARSKEPSYTEARHNYQMAQHLGINLPDFDICLTALKDKQLFIEHVIVTPANPEIPSSKEHREVFLSIDFSTFKDLLEELGASPDITLKTLQHAADDSFDCYDVIEEKFLPVTQLLLGYLSGSDYEKAALLVSRMVVCLNEFAEDFAFKAIAPGWKLLLTVPMAESWESYAQELTVRFMRAGERAIDLSFTDGNLFVPDYAEIKTKCHMVKHYGNKKEPRVLTSAILLALVATFPDKLSYQSELSVSELKDAFILCVQLCPELNAYEHAREILGGVLGDSYFAYRRLSEREITAEKTLLTEILESLKNVPAFATPEKNGV